MQTALFAMMFDDDSDEDEIDKKEFRALNGMMDSLLRGSGVTGAALATVKNAIMEYHKQEKKKFLADHTHTLIQLTSVSPPISSKLRNIYSAILTTKYNKDVIEDRGFAIDQPLYRVGAKVIEAGTNIPLDRALNKINNLSQATEDEFKTWQRIMLALGWSTWDLGLKNQEHELIKVNAKDARNKERYKKAAATRKRNREAEIKNRRRESGSGRRSGGSRRESLKSNRRR